jgi:vacuole morphology and inheritance protein 14
MSVKNGAELLDRLMKDIVAEAAPNYVSIYPSNTNPNLPHRTRYLVDEAPTGLAGMMGLGINHTDERDRDHERDLSPRRSLHKTPLRAPLDSSPTRSAEHDQEDNRAFSLSRFIPLLAERVYVMSPYTRMHLVSWVMVLDSVPDLELVAWLPDFLDGLL